ncbi:MAG: PAS domain S-box protein, partial [Ignavibacteriales bacterium]|nr:PAS domain S-box protein [Ignavibacteriales bacterium]
MHQLLIKNLAAASLAKMQAHSILSSTFLPGFYADKNGYLIDANEHFYSLLGIRKEKSILCHLNCFSYPLFITCGLSEKIQAAFTSGMSMKNQCLLINEAGLEINLEYMLLPEYQSDGKISGCLVLLNILSTPAKIQSDPLLAEALLKHIWEQSVDGMRLTDSKGVILSVNEAFCRMIELERSALEGFDITVMYDTSHDNGQHILHRYSENFQSRQLQSIRESPLKLLSGRTIFVEVSDSFIETQNGETCLFSVFRDITHKKRIEEENKKYSEELRQSNLTKDKFLSLVAHDLKSPFQSILGYSSILCEEFDDLSTVEMRDLLNKLYALNKNVFRLVENLLEWSRLQTGKMRFSPAALNLEDTIQEILRL